MSLLIFNSCNKDDSNPVNNTAPLPPILLFPTNGLTEIANYITLSWNSTENAKFYILQISKSNVFDSYTVNENVGDSTVKSIFGLEKTTTYYWRVSAGNSYGQSYYSTTWSFKTANNPYIPTLVSPRNDSLHIKTPVTVTWDTAYGALSYGLQVSSSASFNTFVFNQSGLTLTSQEITGLNKGIKYYWRVNATNTHGTSPWSFPYSFTTATIPTKPSLSIPGDGVSKVIIPVLFKWSKSITADSYILQVSKDISFSNIVYNRSSLIETNLLVSELNINTIYYWRVSAVNGEGPSSWSYISGFSTDVVQSPCSGISSVNYSGKIYNTVQIGSQCWLKENLDVGTMITGNKIQNNNGIIEKHCYNDSVANCNIYGGLYQWNEAMQYSKTPGTKGICPTDWHIPTQAEFQTLRSAVHDNSDALKEIGQGTGTNSSGFSALLAGRSMGFYELGWEANFWSSTEINSHDAYELYLNNSSIFIQYPSKGSGFSVRCVKD